MNTPTRCLFYPVLPEECKKATEHKIKNLNLLQEALPEALKKQNYTQQKQKAKVISFAFKQTTATKEQP